MFLGKTFEDQIILIVFQPEDHPMTTGFTNEYSQILLNTLLNARDALIEHRLANNDVEAAWAN